MTQFAFIICVALICFTIRSIVKMFLAAEATFLENINKKEKDD